MNLLVAFLNGIAELIENRAFISWNPIDEYVWAEDSNFQFQKIKSEYYSNSIIHKELLTSLLFPCQNHYRLKFLKNTTTVNLLSSKWSPSNG